MKPEKLYKVRSIFHTVQGEGINAGRPALFVRLSGCNLWNGLESGRARGRGECARWCDTDFVDGTKMDQDRIAGIARKSFDLQGRSRDKLVVITGGEPALQFEEHDPLLTRLYSEGYEVALETNGSVPITQENGKLLSLLTVSPKLGVCLAPGTLALRDSDNASRGVLKRELKVVLPGALAPAAGWPDAALLDIKEQLQPDACWVQPMDPFVHREGGKLVPLLLSRRGRVEMTNSESKGEAAFKQYVAQCFEFVTKHEGWRVGVQTHKVLGLE